MSGPRAGRPTQTRLHIGDLIRRLPDPSTYAPTHSVAILAARTSEMLATEQFPTTTSGMARDIARAGHRTGGDVAMLWVIEGVATYGARLAAMASQAGRDVIEAAR